MKNCHFGRSAIQTLNSILMIVIPACSPVDSPLLLLDGLSDLEFSTSWSNEGLVLARPMFNDRSHCLQLIDFT